MVLDNKNIRYKIYLNPTAACQTKANNKKNTGIIGNTSTSGLKTTYASGKRANNKLSISKTSKCKMSNVKYINNIYFTIKTTKNLLYFWIFFNFE